MKMGHRVSKNVYLVNKKTKNEKYLLNLTNC